MDRIRISARTGQIPNAGIGPVMRYASQYPDVISLGQGTPLFPTPRFIYEYLNEQSQTDPAVGMYAGGTKIEKRLYELIIGRMEKDYGFTPKREELCLTVGGVGGLFAAFQICTDPGSEVIYFDPSYPIHLSQLSIAQAVPVFVTLDEHNGWTLDPGKLAAAVTPKTRMIVLTNPNNPTGTVLSEADVRAVADVVLRHDLILVLDEAYGFLTYGKPLFSPMVLDELRSHIILSRSFSKEYAMTGWRLGWTYAPPEITRRMFEMQVNMAINPPTPSMVAATAALSDPRGEKAMDDFRDAFTRSRDVICERLERLPLLFGYHKPDGAYYVFPRFHHFQIPAYEFVTMLIDEAKVITIPGSSMGPAGEGHVRMSFAADQEVIHSAFDRIDLFAKQHRLL